MLYLLLDLLLFYSLLLHQLLAVLIEGEVFQDRGLADMLFEYLKHLDTLLKVDLDCPQKGVNRTVRYSLSGKSENQTKINIHRHLHPVCHGCL